jgi:hypothetical protein
MIVFGRYEIDAVTLAAAAGGLLAIVALLLLWREYRRRRARMRVLAAVTGGAFDYVHNVALPDGQGGSLHFDFLLLTARGCIILDMRNVVGHIFGGDQMTEWTVMHRGARSTFANPQTSLYDRIACVRAIVPQLPIEGRVVFSPKAQFPKGLPRFTLMLGSVAAEFPPAERERVAGLPEGWRGDWQRLRDACHPSPMVARRAAV